MGAMARRKADSRLKFCRKSKQRTRPAVSRSRLTGGLERGVVFAARSAVAVPSYDAQIRREYGYQRGIGNMLFHIAQTSPAGRPTESRRKV